MAKHPNIVIYFAHLDIERSVINRTLCDAVRDMPQVDFRDLHEMYPNFYIDADTEQVLERLHEQGLANFEVVVWHGMYAPKGTPKEALDKVNAALRAALKDPAVANKLKDLGAEIVPESKQTPEGLRSWLVSEIDKWGPVIRSAGQFAD